MCVRVLSIDSRLSLSLSLSLSGVVGAQSWLMRYDAHCREIESEMMGRQLLQQLSRAIPRCRRWCCTYVMCQSTRVPLHCSLTGCLAASAKWNDIGQTMINKLDYLMSHKATASRRQKRSHATAGSAVNYEQDHRRRRRRSQDLSVQTDDSSTTASSASTSSTDTPSCEQEHLEQLASETASVHRLRTELERELGAIRRVRLNLELELESLRALRHQYSTDAEHRPNRHDHDIALENTTTL
jgi:hypothetical protein